MQLAEPIAILDTFASGLGRVDILDNGLARFILYVEETNDDGVVENRIVAKIVVPLDAVPDAILKASAACAVTLVSQVRKLLPHQMH